jgi:hypothetical protein
VEAAKGRRAMSTPQERAERKRKEKLELIRQQIDSGELKVRKMTSSERAANPPRARPEKRKRP